MSMSKEQRKEILNKAVDLAYEGIGLAEFEKRLYDFCSGIFEDSDISFEEVYIAVRRAVLTVRGILEEIKDV